MLQREFTFPSSDGKTDLHAVDWVPDSPVRAVLQISHGVSEYILRYQALASFLTERGTGQGEDASASVTMDMVLSERKRRRAGKARQTALYRTGEGWADRRSS